jgi:hypothetical protein
MTIDYEKELQLDNASETEAEILSPYTIDETLATKKYAFDLNALYIPFKTSETPTTKEEADKLDAKWDNVNRKHIHLQISRNKDKQCELVYSWVSAKGNRIKGYTYTELMSFTRKNVISADEVDAVVKQLHKLGDKLQFELDQQEYQTFFENVVSTITSSTMLDVLKQETYIFPATGDDAEDGIASVINARVNPVLTDEQKQEALEVETKLKDYDDGFIEYINKVLEHKHIGDNQNITRKVLSEFIVIMGWASYFIMSVASAEAGKSYEDEIALSFIPNRYIFKMNAMTKASFTKKSETHTKYFDRLICVFGDLGSQKAFEEMEDVFNIIKILITENEYSRSLNEMVNGKWEDTQQNLEVDSIGAVFQTTKFDFLDVEGDQLASRTIKSTPAEVKTEDVLKHIHKTISYKNSKTNQKIAEADTEIEKFQSYLLQLISKDIEVINPWFTVFERFVKMSNTPYRDLKQIMYLFKAYCTITYFDCDTITDKGLLVASKKQVETFMNEISLENALPPLESEFLKMLIGNDSKQALEIIETDTEEDNALNPLNPYFNAVLEDMGYDDFLPNTSDADDTTVKDESGAVLQSERVIVTIDTLEEYKQKQAIAKLLQMFRLSGTSLNHIKNVFFTVTDVKRAYGKVKAYKNIDDISKLLNKFYKNGFIDKLDYKDKNNQNIYYLTSKCNDINDNITVTETDVSEADKFLRDEIL